MRQLLNRASLSSPLIPRLNPGLLPREAEVRLECDTVRGGCVRSYGRIVLFLISTIFVTACDVQGPTNPTPGAATVTVA